MSTKILNTSGLSFMLRMNRYLTSLGKPNRSILFLGFNAEEFGCLGSNAFIETYISIKRR
ncbi:M28 family peptidase [Clostridium sp.]|uniref:M28 family peptidase n=1 Tax=Clostridium sp. TaxID=1506 RepID=UPI003D6D4E4C